MRSSEPPCTTRRRVKSVAVEKAKTPKRIIRQAPGAMVLPKGAKDGTQNRLALRDKY
jgi:hypothetical protein